MNTEQLIDRIIQWGEDRNLIKGSTPERQVMKTQEELDELKEAIGEENGPAIMDGIGDVTVTLILIAAQLGMRFEDCVAAAYEEIKDRKGSTVDGLFVKEG